MLRLENWSVVAGAEQCKCFIGNVYGHPNFEDGASGHTSVIEKINSENETVETYSGSVYTLGEVDPEYEAQFPNARERLFNPKGDVIDE